MLASVGCLGYRRFERATEVELAALTVIFGKNNSGKTTLTRLPLFIQASMKSSSGFALASDQIRFGSSFRDLANRDQPHPVLSYWVRNQSGAEWETQLKSISREFEEEIQATHVSIAAVPSDLQGESSPIEVDPPVETLAVGQVVHILSARPEVAPVYEARPPVGATVDEAMYWLYQFPELRRDVEGWLESNFDGMTLDVEESSFGFEVVSGTGVYSANYAASGRGTQSVLPVVVLLKAIALGLCPADLVILEEPEAHLHPSAHTAVAELIAEVSATCQIVVETHSENLLLRLRRKVAEQKLEASDLSLVYVDDDAEVRRIHVDSTGGVTDWPRGVFEYDVLEAQAIVQARLSAMDV